MVAAEGQMVIDGNKRIAALEQLGRDTEEAVAWPGMTRRLFCKTARCD